MAIGDFNSNGNNQSNNKAYENTYYSRIRFKNGDKQINYNFHSGLLQLEAGTIDNNNGFKFEAAATIYLSVMKAHLLVSQIDTFLAYREAGEIDPNKAFGVTAGMGEKISFIGFSTDENKKIYITIGKFDGTGAITESFKYEFANDYHYALEWNDITANDIIKVYDNTAEVIVFRNLIADFARNMNGAVAYSVADTTRYDLSRMNRRVDQIFDRLGIERQQYNGGGNRNYGNNNFLSNASSTSKSTSYEDVEDLLA